MDRESLFSSLNDRDVEYVVIGAAAFPAHGYARSTLDIDIFIRYPIKTIQKRMEKCNNDAVRNIKTCKRINLKPGISDGESGFGCFHIGAALNMN